MVKTDIRQEKNELDFIPFDVNCFSKLESGFYNVFESKLMDEICESGKLKTYPANKILVDIGTSINYLPLVISGSIKVMTEDSKGNELLLYYLESGATCAVTLKCCTTESKSTVRAITETESKILLVPIEKMDEWMLHYRTWRNYILSSYNLRLNEMVQAFDNVVFNNLEKRLLKYLRDKAVIAGTHILKISHQDIADELYATRVSVSRLMRKLEANKQIEQKRNKVIIKHKYTNLIENSTIEALEQKVKHD